MFGKLLTWIYVCYSENLKHLISSHQRHGLGPLVCSKWPFSNFQRYVSLLHIQLIGFRNPILVMHFIVVVFNTNLLSTITITIEGSKLKKKTNVLCDDILWFLHSILAKFIRDIEKGLIVCLGYNWSGNIRPSVSYKHYVNLEVGNWEFVQLQNRPPLLSSGWRCWLEIT